MNIVFLDSQTIGKVSNFKLFEQLGQFTEYPVTLPEERLNRCREADIIITCKVIIDKDIMDSCPRIRLICVAATGTNNIDLDYARSMNIQVKNVAGYSTESVAQSTLAMILHLVNQLSYFDRYVKSGAYCHSDMFTHYGPPVFELKGKQAGIIGLGNIGTKVARLLTAFGMRVTYYSTSGINRNSDYERLELTELLATSDIVSIHAPLNEQTRYLIRLPQLKQMKPTAIIINAGRGGIIHEQDLAEAINQNIIAGAGLDVFEKEPMVPESPVLNIRNPDRIVLAPHVAWTSIEAREMLVEKIALNIREFLQERG